jgi:tetratricopeptide (TPR) repeat protein/tRNA A-37 threonylcarbamoyl transferase component Bud32
MLAPLTELRLKTAAAQDLVGQQIGPLRILAPLGHGGMGVVYEARHEKLGRHVAVKVLREHDRFHPEARARLLREAQILSQLSHPNICLIHDYLDDGDRDVVVLELVTGRSLREEVADGRLAAPKRYEVAEQILAALAAAHDKGVVHRDLKPENVMITPGGQVKILDFGLAQLYQDLAPTEAHRPPAVSVSQSPGASLSASSALTPAGHVTGTVDYMSPEQARGEEATPASDIYSLGLVLQELFTGKRLRRTGPIPARLEAAMRGETTPVSGVDGDLAALLERMKSGSPGSRPSAVDALERLRWIHGKPRRRLNRLVASGAVAALALLAAGMAWQAHRARQAAERAEQAWAEAESLTTFMLEDLMERLRPLGRLDLLDQVADEAQRYYQKVPTELQSAERSYRHGLALRTLGQVLELEGRWDHAEGSYRKVLELAQQLAAAEPADPRFQDNLRRSWDDLGDVLLEQGKVTEAEAAFREALALSERMAQARPQDLQVLGALSDGWDDLGGLQQERGDLAAAMKSYEEALAVDRRLTGRDPGDAAWQSKLARSYHRIGTVHEARGALPLARAAYDETLRIDREIAADNAGDTEHQMNLAQAYYDLARVHQAEGNVPAAVALLDEALAIDRRLVEQDPSNARWRAALGRVWLAKGDLLAAAGRQQDAAAAWAEARSVLALLSGTPYRALYEEAVGRGTAGAASAATREGPAGVGQAPAAPGR